MTIADDILSAVARMESLIEPLRDTREWSGVAIEMFLELDAIREIVARKLPTYDPAHHILDPYVSQEQDERGECLIHAASLVGDIPGSQQAITREVQALVKTATELGQLPFLRSLLRKTAESIVAPQNTSNTNQCIK